MRPCIQYNCKHQKDIITWNFRSPQHPLFLQVHLFSGKKHKNGAQSTEYLTEKENLITCYVKSQTWNYRLPLNLKSPLISLYHYWQIQFLINRSQLGDQSRNSSPPLIQTNEHFPHYIELQFII